MKTKKLVLLVGDIAVLYLSLIVALLVRYRSFDFDIFQAHLTAFTPVFIVWIVIFYIHNLYDINLARNSVVFYSAIWRAFLINIALAILFFYLAPQFSEIDISPKTNLFLTTIIFVVLAWLWRNLFNKIVGLARLGINVAIVGGNAQATELAEEILDKPQLGYKLKLIISPDKKTDTLKSSGVRIKKDFKNFKESLLQEKISVAIVAPEVYKSLKNIQDLFECLRQKIDFTNLSSFYEKFNEKIPLSAINQAWFLENISQGRKEFYEFSKRISDIVISTLCLLLSLPFWPLLALLVKLQSTGPVFYSQSRIGQGGHSFRLTKFRTMVANAEKNGPQMTQKNDPRITKIGKFLRRTRLDELPQLWNVIKGEMAFIGPRAERPEFHEELKKKIPFYQERYLTKPGLSGWAQIKYGYSSSVEENFEKVQYDLYYVKNRSLVFDLGIILKTINIILRGGGR